MILYNYNSSNIYYIYILIHALEQDLKIWFLLGFGLEEGSHTCQRS